MKIAVDFDGTIVDDTHAYDDLTTPLAFLPGARGGLLRLKAASHILVLYSARANRWLFSNPEMDPFVIAGIKKLDRVQWAKSKELNEARYRQMIDFVNRELPGVFSLIWEHQGKPSVDLFIDDRGADFRLRGWRGIIEQHGV